MAATNTLPQLVAETKDITSALIENGGELSPEMEAALCELQVQLPAKIDGYAILLDRLALEETYWKAKADQFARISKGCASTIKFLETRIKQAAIDLGTSEFAGNDYKFTVSNSNPAVEITDEKALDSAYLKVVTETKIDKKKIAEDLKQGFSVPGAVLKESKTLRISANRKVGA